MSKSIDLQELLKNKVIEEDVAEKIKAFYKSKEEEKSNKSLVVFSILGCLLIALGVILILAHNWDELPKAIRLFFAFLPLVTAQVLAAFVIFKKPENKVWREGVGVLLFFAIATSISLVSQIYNISGDFGKFLLVWMVLALPCIYLLKSSFVSLLYVIGITWYAVEVDCRHCDFNKAIYYVPLLLAVLPYYFSSLKKGSAQVVLVFHHWFLPLSATIVMLTIVDRPHQLLDLNLCALFSSFILIGSLPFFNQNKLIADGYKIVGALGNLILLFVLSFDWYWNLLFDSPAFSVSEYNYQTAFSAVLCLLALALYFYHFKRKSFGSVPLLGCLLLLFIPLFFIGFYSKLTVVAINLAILGIAIDQIFKGAKEEHLGQLNFGLVVITALIFCRFLDSDLSFVVRGILFITVGIGFFGLNIWIIKKRNSNGK
ncbi:MAG: DUF2157 domain-containing protein [Bacteroidetes bacterium]|nr:DUF2157 domain-containing protein [Bacteroidota bacterium]